MKDLFKAAVLILSVLLVDSCKKDNVTVPVVETSEVTQISYDNAKGGGNITGTGGGPLLSAGLCWSTTAKPTISGNSNNITAVPGPFTSTMTLLRQNTHYYVRAYATNSAGTGYGEEVSFTTINGEVPLVTTSAVTSITMNSAVCGGTVTGERGAAITSRGVCWSLNPGVSILDNKTSNGSGTGGFSSNITGLTEGTTYYIKAYATNSNGTGYGIEKSFNTTAPVR